MLDGQLTTHPSANPLYTSSSPFSKSYLLQNGTSSDVGIYKFDPAVKDLPALEFTLSPGVSDGLYELHEYNSNSVLAYANPNDRNVHGIGKLYNVASPPETWFWRGWNVSTDTAGRKILGYKGAGAGGEMINTFVWKGFGPQRCSKEKAVCEDPSWCGSLWCDGFVFILCGEFQDIY